MMAGIIIAIVLVYLFMTFLIGMGWLHGLDMDICTPKDIYDRTGMNWFGSIVVYILFMITGFTIWLLCFLEWLFYIGRK